MTNAIKSHFPALVAAHSFELPPIVDGKAPEWVKLLPTGGFSGRDGRGPYDAGDEAHLQTVVATTQKRAGSTDVVFDYDHQTVFSAVPGVGGRAPASGWIKEYQVRPDGLWARVDWTRPAAHAIARKEYRYVSPVYHHDKSGKVLGLLSAALTNTPNLDLPAVAASANLTNQEPQMDKIALALGLAQEASEDDILTAINAVLTGSAAIAAAAGLDKTAKTEDVVTAIQSARTVTVDPTKYVPIEQVQAMQADLTQLKETARKDKAEDAVGKAIADGKLAPAMKDWGLALHKADPAQFEAFTAKAPVLTSTQRTTITPPAATDTLTDEDVAVMSQMGLSRDAYLKAKKGGDA
jgi:phage I-like protein